MRSQLTLPPAYGPPFSPTNAPLSAIPFSVSSPKFYIFLRDINPYMPNIFASAHTSHFFYLSFCCVHAHSFFSSQNVPTAPQPAAIHPLSKNIFCFIVAFSVLLWYNDRSNISYRYPFCERRDFVSYTKNFGFRHKAGVIMPISSLPGKYGIGLFYVTAAIPGWDR